MFRKKTIACEHQWHFNSLSLGGLLSIFLIKGLQSMLFKINVYVLVPFRQDQPHHNYTAFITTHPINVHLKKITS